MSNKPYDQMDEAELREELRVWGDHVEGAGGWASAHFAAKQVASICKWAERRGYPDFVNLYPIQYTRDPFAGGTLLAPASGSEPFATSPQTVNPEPGIPSQSITEQVKTDG